MKDKEKRLVFPHHTSEWMKLSVRIFASLTLSAEYIKDIVLPWWEDNCLDMCAWLEHNDNNEEYLIDVYNSLEVVFELICRGMKEGKEISDKQTEEIDELIKKHKENNNESNNDEH